MTDSQILTVALSLTIPLAMLIYSNSRVTEAKETLRAEIRSSKLELELKISLLEAKMDLAFERLEHKIDALLKISADHEAKLSKL